MEVWYKSGLDFKLRPSDIEAASVACDHVSIWKGLGVRSSSDHQSLPREVSQITRHDTLKRPGPIPGVF